MYRRAPAHTRFWSRRRWLFSVAGLGAWSFHTAAANAKDAPQAETLRVFVDALLPADAQSPAASALAVHTQILNEASHSPDLRLLVRDGCRWLTQSVGNLAALDAAQLERLLNAMSEADWDTGPRNFFYQIRDRAVTLYYADPRAWSGLAIQRPPQPIGYPDAASP